MPEATVNGVSHFYTEVGSGPPFIVLHGGLGFDHTYMKHSLDALADVMRLVYIDFRGNGRSGRPALETITVPQLADDVEALRVELGLDRVGLIGHSYGGFVALQYAVRYTDRLSHLICYDTSPGGFEPTPEELAERADESWITDEVRAAAQVLSEPMPDDPEVMRAWLPKIAPAYMRSSDILPMLAACAGMIIEPATMAQSMQALAGWSVLDGLGGVTAPTLVMCGRYDLVTPPECAKRIATAVPGAELVWFENSGHFPEIEEADKFNATVRDFVRRHG